MEVTRTVVYQGPAPFVGMLAQALRDEGVQVEYAAPEERRGLGADVTEVIVNVISMGTGAAIGAGIANFRKRMPRAKVKVMVEREDGQLVEDEG